MNRDIRAAVVQFQHAPGDKGFNMGRVRAFAKQASADGVELVIFPEMCLTGYWHVRNLSRDEIAARAEPVPSGASTRELLKLAQGLRATIGAGLIERSDDGTFYNTYVVAMPDGRVARHRKIHAFENEHIAAGSEYTVFDLPLGCRAAILTCYDNNIIENARIVALRGAEVLLAPHQTGGCKTPSPRCMGRIDPHIWEQRFHAPEAIEAEIRGPKGREWLMRWLPARAHDNGMFLLFSNGIGLDDGEVRTGNSMILDPYGEILAETWRAGDDMVIARLEASRLDNCTGRRWIRTRRPALYSELAVLLGNEQDTRTARFASIGDQT